MLGGMSFDYSQGRAGVGPENAFFGVPTISGSSVHPEQFRDLWFGESTVGIPPETVEPKKSEMVG